MNRLNFKITAAAAILAVVAIVTIIAFWPGKTDEITSEDLKLTPGLSFDEPGISQPEKLFRKAVLFNSAQGRLHLLSGRCRDLVNLIEGVYPERCLARLRYAMRITKTIPVIGMPIRPTIIWPIIPPIRFRAREISDVGINFPAEPIACYLIRRSFQNR